MTTKTKADEIEEGARAFTVLLASMKDEDDEGNPCGLSALDRLNEEVHGVVSTLRDESIARDAEVKGSVTITVDLSVFKSKAKVAVTTKRKLPDPPKVKPVDLFVTRGGNLSTEQPKQKKLPLHAVEGGAADNETVNTKSPRAI